MPPFGDLVAAQGKLEGYLRYVHSRVLQNAVKRTQPRTHVAARTRFWCGSWPAARLGSDWT
jgi:hypothetical protein